MDLHALKPFKMSRSINSVADAWNEYEHGTVSSLNKIIPSIKSLDLQNIKWKGPASGAEGKFYSRRRSLWISILRIKEETSLHDSLILMKFESMCRIRNGEGLRSLCNSLDQDLKACIPPYQLVDYWNQQGIRW